MDLPLRLFDRRTDERVISVDGAWGQPGLNLSHWPGNATPAELKHELSTGIALAFARLDESRRRELARGCTAIANNHYDTDGVCALYAVRHPERALQRAERLIDAAWAGDFFRLPNERAFQIDCIVAGLADPERSPWRERFAGADDRARREWVLREIVESFDAILDGDLDEHADLWRAELERLRADRTALAQASRDDIAHLDLCVFTGRSGAGFDPGRHALFGATPADRILVAGPRGSGATWRFLLGTSSWFDLPERRVLPRPALEEMAARLNEMEGSRADDAIAWRAQGTSTPSPELWFGGADRDMFAEHAPALAESRLAPAHVREVVLDGLRAAWTFPDD